MSTPPAPLPDETPLARTRRARRMYRVLTERHPDAECELDFRDPFELLVATVMSAQTTDVAVNAVTPALFAAYPDAESLAAAEHEVVEEIIRRTGFYRAKTRSIIALAQALVADHGGEVPGRLTDLVKLPGVGRKTANVVLGNAFDVPGITVDTHFGRLARRMGWTDQTDPVKAEHEVAGLFPRKVHTDLSHTLIFHGRRVCHSRRPACGACPVARWCPSAETGVTGEKEAWKLVKGSVPVGFLPPDEALLPPRARGLEPVDGRVEL
ncbi:DNA-(apurinic or apyrimidinic site) lyase /endonuclease III [Kytococcus aerolatus]|uniref:Endonuclease III n=1 Tax=Kytococcus aerolatus TaxID=592308 RepID=A0A212U6Y8_9MICO|nr:endonuclease III [Kytococcus aerolatus]SNC73831.1 DNA-(apurinic or apyrimidinic site) lyase /endonuclease III [Kytococcus aerolatus]